MFTLDMLNKPGGKTLFKNYIKNNQGLVSKEIIRRIIWEDYSDDNLTIISNYYESFENKNRWTIKHYYIVEIDNEKYRFFCYEGLTENIENVYIDCNFEKVELKWFYTQKWRILDE